MSDASMEQNWCKWPEHDWQRFVDVSNKLIAAERLAMEPERLKDWLRLLDAARDILDEGGERERRELRAAIDKLRTHQCAI